jgi:Flp pilus assembly protein TadG
MFLRKRRLSLCNSRRRSFAQNENGESLVAFALTLPIMFGFIFGLLQVSMAFYTYEYISELAREGTRYAIVHGADCVAAGGSSCTVTSTGVQSYVAGIGLPNVGGGTLNVAATYPLNNEAPGSPVLVKVSYNFPFNIPFMPTSSISMASSSEMYIVQ